ncbi:alpha-mannosidase [Apostasia shenzhenica]|uniref:Alpha-mannosidase n=1 Tax=Apostasia shenzhenica TaxID=1088818 RepID=A0A2I0B919_9ASPA|nr:alpha-mannosidase [Apostasia shenzhenica]
MGAEIWSSDDGFAVHETSDDGFTGAFVAGTAAAAAAAAGDLLCLKAAGSNNLSAMPDIAQIFDLLQIYSPWIYFHPDEPYLPSSVSWFFDNGALLYSKENPNSPIGIDSAGAALPQGGTNDGAYWLDLPADNTAKQRVKSGNLSAAESYIHVKPVLGGSATDIVFWIFYPFNGPARAKVFISISLGKIGEHVGDWEHVTLRISNFDGKLQRMYFSQHSSGKWVEVADLEFADGGRRPTAYSTLHGHAFYPKAGLVLQGEVEPGIGVRDDTAAGGQRMDAAARAVVAAAEYLGVREPAWLQYMREWGPKVSYDVEKEIGKVEKILPRKMKSGLRRLVSRLPPEMLGEEGPTGPKAKANWNGDEVS